ncbi:Uncharacterized protein TCM_031009 isoform 2, partial [Theobroma cacao]
PPHPSSKEHRSDTLQGSSPPPLLWCSSRVGGRDSSRERWNNGGGKVERKGREIQLELNLVLRLLEKSLQLVAGSGFRLQTELCSHVSAERRWM